jgi:hypothetical protein
MRWFRSQRLKVASLALFALTCQFVLSFGHVHLDRLSGNSIRWAVAAATRKAVAAVPEKAAELPARPDDRNSSRLGEDFCAICASINLAGALVAPNAPTLLPEISFYKELYWSFAATQAQSVDRFHFDARGPPVV